MVPGISAVSAKANGKVLVGHDGHCSRYSDNNRTLSLVKISSVYLFSFIPKKKKNHLSSLVIYILQSKYLWQTDANKTQRFWSWKASSCALPQLLALGHIFRFSVKPMSAVLGSHGGICSLKASKRPARTLGPYPLFLSQRDYLCEQS